MEGFGGGGGLCPKHMELPSIYRCFSYVIFYRLKHTQLAGTKETLAWDEFACVRRLVMRFSWARLFLNVTILRNKQLKDVIDKITEEKSNAK